MTDIETNFVSPMKYIVAGKVNKKVAVGLSGGVDSSVSAYLLNEQGYEVTGVYIQCWAERADGCRADEDRADAAAVAGVLGIKFEHLDFIKEYKAKVIDYFYKEYQAGRTPNPDVMCNRDIKFGMFMKWAEENGFDMIATGHYARISEKDGKYSLLKGVDTSKDQSYFLYLLDQEQLSRTLFPVGDMVKADVRVLAEKAGLPTYRKPDSVGICFIGEVDIKEFLKKRINPVTGNVVDKTGKAIGQHEGAQFYTIGQRHGFTVEEYTGLPMYVIGKNMDENELIVGFANDVNRDSFCVSELHWINDTPVDEFVCDVRIRHLGELHKSIVKLEKGVAEVKMEEPIFGVAPGQSAVFYKGDVVLGGGIIE